MRLPIGLNYVPENNVYNIATQKRRLAAHKSSLVFSPVNNQVFLDGLNQIKKNAKWIDHDKPTVEEIRTEHV